MSLKTSFKFLKLLRTNFGSSMRRCPLSLTLSSSSSTNAVSYTHRTDTCGSLRKDDVGKIVKLCGWVLYQRVGFFVILRDWDGITQLVIPKDKVELLALASKLSKESVLEVTGKVILRPPGEENTAMTTGHIEVEVHDLKVLNSAIKDLPFSLKKFDKVNEATRMEYRYLDIRTDQMQRNLRLRSKMIMKMREFLVNKHEFVDVETPTLFRRTPGGAKEFIVPCQHPGKFYCLPQSPQQFKQLLMVGGIDRYFQIARCYRNEGAKPDRQPEFTQLDIEMSFVEQEGIIKLIEDMLVHCWPSEKPLICQPFPRITYDSAMRLYGVDKPDTRFDMQLLDVTSHFNQCGVQDIENILKNKHASVVAIKLINDMKHFSKTWIQNSIKSAQEKLSDKQTKVFVVQSTDAGQFQGGISKHMKEDVMKDISGDNDLHAGDFLVLAAGLHYKPHELLGKLRLQSADHLESNGVSVRKQDSYNFLWVQDFPLFVPKEDGNGLESAHHPFTDVHPEDRQKFHVHPEQVRGQHYDLVLNGNEVGGGSIRIHNSDFQKHVLQNILEIDVSELQHLLEALSMGCPPHGGIALGLDRLFAIICGSPSIRDVIAFPKSHDGKDLMSKAPTSVSAADLDLYHISVKLTSS